MNFRLELPVRGRCTKCVWEQTINCGEGMPHTYYWSVLDKCSMCAYREMIATSTALRKRSAVSGNVSAVCGSDERSTCDESDLSRKPLTKESMDRERKRSFKEASDDLNVWESRQRELEKIPTELRSTLSVKLVERQLGRAREKYRATMDFFQARSR